ncbi:MAG: divergent PAP2 family protein [Candidatus Eisenbacteria bacterium]
MGLNEAMQKSPLLVACSCGLLVQIIKGVAFLLKEKRVNFKRFVQTGGMPSSHSAAVCALSTAIGNIQGYNSPLFHATAFFSFIVMFDAAGMRRAVGRQATILNRLVHEHMKKAREEKLLELLGHTPFEVFVGAAIGILYALAWF